MLTKKPRKNDRLRYNDGKACTVVSVEGRIAWIRFDGERDATCFIWGFVSPGGPVMSHPPKIDEGLYPNQCFHEVQP